MERKAKVTAGIAMVVVAGLAALAAPAVASTVGEASSWPVFAGSDEPSQGVAVAALTAAVETVGAVPADAADPEGAATEYVDLGQGVSVPAGGPGDCTATSWLNIAQSGDASAHATLLGPELVDMGPSEFAGGTAHHDDQGRIVSYTVAAGDVTTRIGERFCLGNGVALDSFNHKRTIHPGDVLILRPDPEIAWIPSYSPNDAPAGFQQAPYQAAMIAMGEASAAGDVARMRSIWTDKLSAMTTHKPDRVAIESALASGDLRVLRQMFP